MTAWVAGSTHIVLLPMNVILAKECEESKLSVSIGMEFFEQLQHHRRKLQPLLIHSTVGK